MTPNTPSSGMIINWLILITLGVIWGASFLGVELALTGFGPITLAAGRVSAAALILLVIALVYGCLLYTSPSPRDATLSRMPSSA